MKALGGGATRGIGSLHARRLDGPLERQSCEILSIHCSDEPCCSAIEPEGPYLHGVKAMPQAARVLRPPPLCRASLSQDGGVSMSNGSSSSSSVGIVAILAIVVLVGLAAWFIWGRSGNSRVSPAAATSAPSQPAGADIHVKVNLPDSVSIKP
jgi:hypothetical protein